MAKQSIGRDRESQAILACLDLEKSILIEGPVGVGKTHLACDVVEGLGRPFFRVDGDGRFSESKLTGWFDPPAVMKNGYKKDSFIEGPLLQAMKSGGVLFINELNRMPEGVQNVLLPAIDEGMIHIPKIGDVKAKKGFCVIATQNPKEFVATHHLSEALLDRFELVQLSYLSKNEELEILNERFPKSDVKQKEFSVEVVRQTRSHPSLSRGASVRAALSICELITKLESKKIIDATRVASHLCLSNRIELLDGDRAGLSKVIDECVDLALKKKA